MAGWTGGVGHRLGVGRVLRFGLGGVSVSAGVIQVGGGPCTFWWGALVVHGMVGEGLAALAWLYSMAHSAFHS